MRNRYPCMCVKVQFKSFKMHCLNIPHCDQRSWNEAIVKGYKGLSDSQALTALHQLSVLYEYTP